MEYRLFAMQTLSGLLGSHAAPAYIRWPAEQTPFTLELNLEVVHRIRQELSRSGSAAEIGGMLIGPLLDERSVLRVSEVQFLKAAPNAANVFLLDPRERDRLIAARSMRQSSDQALVGFFRTHRRRGPLRPSLADRTLLAGEFGNRPYLLLLISAVEPYTAAFFVCAQEELAQEPSVKEFRFDHESLKALPEVNEHPASSAPAFPLGRAARRAPERSGISPVFAGCFLAASVLATAFAWSGTPDRATLHPDPSPGLQVNGSSVLQITWKQNSTPVKRAAAGRITIADDDQRRELTIARDELRHGSVEYQASGSSVRVQLTLDMPGGYSVSQAALWRR